MLARALRAILLFLVAPGMLFWSYSPANSRAQAATDGSYPGVDSPASVIGILFTQPIDPIGKLLQSSWLDPDGSDNDRYVWDNFTLPTPETITEIDWLGGYDPLLFGAGGPVLDFSVKIYPSTALNTQPDIANPLVQYLTGGNAGESWIGDVGGIPMYAYAFSLPTSFIAAAGEKYWVQIEAFQGGSIPDWGIAAGTGGEGSHYLKESGAGGDIIYHFAPKDAAFTLLGPVPPTPTDIMLANNRVDENQPVDTIVGELTAASPDPNATFTFDLACAVGGTDDGYFNILGTSLRTLAIFDFETKSVYDICIRVTEQGGLTFEKNFTVLVNDLFEATQFIYLPVIIR